MQATGTVLEYPAAAQAAPAAADPRAQAALRHLAAEARAGRTSSGGTIALPLAPATIKARMESARLDHAILDMPPWLLQATGLDAQALGKRLDQVLGRHDVLLHPEELQGLMPGVKVRAFKASHASTRTHVQLGSGASSCLLEVRSPRETPRRDLRGSIHEVIANGLFLAQNDIVDVARFMAASSKGLWVMTHDQPEASRSGPTLKAAGLRYFEEVDEGLFKSQLDMTVVPDYPIVDTTRPAPLNSVHTAMHRALFTGDDAAALAELRPDVPVADEMLAQAALFGRVDLVGVLFDHAQADAARGPDRRTALLDIARKQRRAIEDIEALNLDAHDHRGRLAALLRAAPQADARFAIAAELTAAGQANFERPNSEFRGLQPLGLAIKYSRDEADALMKSKLLIECGALIEADDESGQTASHFAAEKGHLELMRLLIDAGAKLDRGDIDNKTPLYVAVENRHAEVVRELVKAKARVDVESEFGRAVDLVRNPYREGDARLFEFLRFMTPVKDSIPLLRGKPVINQARRAYLETRQGGATWEGEGIPADMLTARRLKFLAERYERKYGIRMVVNGNNPQRMRKIQRAWYEESVAPYRQEDSKYSKIHADFSSDKARASLTAHDRTLFDELSARFGDSRHMAPDAMELRAFVESRGEMKQRFDALIRGKIREIANEAPDIGLSLVENQEEVARIRELAREEGQHIIYLEPIKTDVPERPRLMLRGVDRDYAHIEGAMATPDGLLINYVPFRPPVNGLNRTCFPDIYSSSFEHISNFVGHVSKSREQYESEYSEEEKENHRLAGFTPCSSTSSECGTYALSYVLRYVQIPFHIEIMKTLVESKELTVTLKHNGFLYEVNTLKGLYAMGLGLEFMDGKEFSFEAFDQFQERWLRELRDYAMPKRDLMNIKHQLETDEQVKEITLNSEIQYKAMTNMASSKHR